MMGIYLAVKLEFDWTKRFVESGNVDGQTDKKQTNDKWKNKWNYTNFERNIAMMVIYLPVKLEFDWTKLF